MIRKFSCKETQKIWDGFYSKKLHPIIQEAARRKLRILNNAFDINDLRIPAGNYLKKLKGKRNSEWSIRINDKWRICFIWKDECAVDVQIEDYH